jgi:hypothetical protein
MSTPHEDAVKNKLSLITVAMAQNNFFTPQEIARCIGWICGQGEPRASNAGWPPVQLTDTREPIERAVQIYNILATQKTDESKHHNVCTLTRNVVITFPPPVSQIAAQDTLHRIVQQGPGWGPQRTAEETEEPIEAPASKKVTFDRDRSGPSTGPWAAVMCPRCMRGDIGRCLCAQSSRDREEIERMHKWSDSTRKQLEEQWEARQKNSFGRIAQYCTKCSGASTANCACAKEEFIRAWLERAERLSNRE